MPTVLERPLPGPQGYKRLVRILARTFYAGECPPREEDDDNDGTSQHHQHTQSQDHLPTTTNNNNPAAPSSSKLSKPPPRNPKQDTTGLGILLLDYLCSNKVGGYVEEVAIASDLRLSQKNIRKALRHLETERLVSSESVKISIRRQNAQLPDDAEVEERKRQETRVFWCLDYPRLRDSLRLRVYAVKDLLHKRISESVPIQEYLCTSCGAVYSSLDAPRLIDPRSGVFRCEEEMCGYELIPKIDGTFGSNGGNSNSSTSRRDAEAYFKDVQRRLEAQLAPLIAQLDHLKDTMPPDYGTLQDWYQRHKEAHERRQKRLEAARKRAGDAGMNMSEEELLDWVDRAEVAVDFGGGGGSKDGGDGGGDGEGDEKGSSVKELPVWFQHDAIYSGGGGGGGGSVQISQEVGGVGGSNVSSVEEAEGAEIERKKIEQAYLQQYLAQVEAAKASVQVDFYIGGGGEEDEGGRKRVKLEEKEEEEKVNVEQQERVDEEEDLLWEDV